MSTHYTRQREYLYGLELAKCKRSSLEHRGRHTLSVEPMTQMSTDGLQLRHVTYTRRRYDNPRITEYWEITNRKLHKFTNISHGRNSHLGGEGNKM